MKKIKLLIQSLFYMSVMISAPVTVMGGYDAIEDMPLNYGPSSIFAQLERGSLEAEVVPLGTMNGPTITNFYCEGKIDSNADQFEIFGTSQPNVNYCVTRVFGGGCLDTAALNYDENATFDDGSCIYPECDHNRVIFKLYANSWADEMSWIFGPDSLYYGGYEDNTHNTHSLCLEDGCYDITLLDSFGDGWNGSALSVIINGQTHTLSLPVNPGTELVYTMSINQADSLNEIECLLPEIYGCADSLAINFNFYATIDDGSCLYNSGSDTTIYCDADYTLIVDSIQENTVWVINNSTGVDLEYFWDFGDGETSSEAYPTHTYESDSLFFFCLRVTSSIGDEIICEDHQCDTVSGWLFDAMVADGVGLAPMEGYTLNVIQDITNTVEYASNIQNVKIYPNPANIDVSISFNAKRPDILQVKMYSINGLQISADQWTISSGNSSKQFNLQGLESGIYMISITGEHTQLQERIIKL